ncbi:hypothetical protein FXO38_00948 [Capsicum annuum]|nr:hypothetical protein FXO37_35847 [Capsicum annuum]KAF3683069.1 hypothetical protein FXO38_00948 [Capsicum annuum]
MCYKILGGCFASGFIDLGGLHVSQISSLSKVWSAYEGVPDDLGSTFFEPTNLPNGLFMFVSYRQPNNMPLFGWNLAGKDTLAHGFKSSSRWLNDCAYWLDLPTDDAAKSNIKKGDLLGAATYLHVKPMFGATYTDIAVWLFYPFNEPAKAKLEFMTITLGKIGEHVGDWNMLH